MTYKILTNFDLSKPRKVTKIDFFFNFLIFWPFKSQKSHKRWLFLENFYTLTFQIPKKSQIITFFYRILTFQIPKKSQKMTYNILTNFDLSKPRKVTKIDFFLNFLIFWPFKSQKSHKRWLFLENFYMLNF